MSRAAEQLRANAKLSSKTSAPGASVRQASGRSISSQSSLRSVASTAAADVEQQLAEVMEMYAKMEAEAKTRSALMQDSIKQNRQAWVALKQENKELQAMMAARGGTALQAEGKSPVERQLEQLEMKVHELRRQHDKILQEKKTAVSKLQNRQDSLDHVSRGTGVVGAGAPVGAGLCTKGAREMRQLENRLDKAVLKANEAQSIRHTYEQVLETLKQEQLVFDPCVKALETALKNKTAEQHQATQAQREAQRHKEAAKHELSALEERLAKDRVARAARLDSQRAAVRMLGDANTALMARQLQGAAAAGVAQGGKVTGAGLATTGLSETAPLVSTPQEAVSALLGAVPGARLANLCSQLVGQQQTLTSLTDMKHAAVHKVSEVTGQLEAAKALLEDLQSGGKTARSTQVALDAAQAQLAHANTAAEAAKKAHDLVMKTYVDVRSGVEHLSTMLAPLPLPPGHIPVPLSDDTLGDVLAQCQQRLVASLAFIQTLPKAAELLDNMMQNPELSFSAAGAGEDVSLA